MRMHGRPLCLNHILSFLFSNATLGGHGMEFDQTFCSFKSEPDLKVHVQNLGVLSHEIWGLKRAYFRVVLQRKYLRN